MLIDTHCHLNFKTFDDKIKEVIGRAKEAGVGYIVVPGTDFETSKKAVAIAEKYDGIYVAIGVHPHHVFQVYKARYRNFLAPVGTLPIDNGESQVAKNLVSSLSKLLINPKVVAIGEVGIDKHYYQKTKHKGYQINEEFLKLQKDFFIEQIRLAIKYKKALIIHNREAKNDVLEILSNYQQLAINNYAVFHCCEPDEELLEFAKKHKIFIGLDGDITYRKDKQEFIKKIPLDLLVLETDSPFLTPQLDIRRSHDNYLSNEPKNIVVIADFISKLINISVSEVEKITTENAKKLFKI